MALCALHAHLCFSSRHCASVVPPPASRTRRCATRASCTSTIDASSSEGSVRAGRAPIPRSPIRSPRIDPHRPRVPSFGSGGRPPSHLDPNTCRLCVSRAHRGYPLPGRSRTVRRPDRLGGWEGRGHEPFPSPIETRVRSRDRTRTHLPFEREPSIEGGGRGWRKQGRGHPTIDTSFDRDGMADDLPNERPGGRDRATRAPYRRHGTTSGHGDGTDATAITTVRVLRVTCDPPSSLPTSWWGPTPKRPRVRRAWPAPACVYGVPTWDGRVRRPCFGYARCNPLRRLGAAG